MLSFKYNLSELKKLALLLIISSLASFGCDLLNFPIPWLLAPMIIGISYGAIQGSSQSLPNIFNIIGQSIIAIVTASRFSLDTLLITKDYAVPLFLCITVTGSMSIANGLILSKFAGIDRSTSFLGSIPGAGPSLVAMSEDIGADAIAVAVLQYLRILMVSAIIPILAGFFFTESKNQIVITNVVHNSLPSLPIFSSLIILSFCSVLGIWLGKRLKLPSALFLGPFLSSLLLFWFLPFKLTIPPLAFTIGLLFLGLCIGVKFDLQTAKKLLKAVLIEIALILVLIIVCFLVGYEFHLITKVDVMTAVLGSTPGGLTAMIATVIQLGGDTSLVLAMQMTRMLLILILSPIFATSLVKNSHNLNSQQIN
jgi:membrane AbrB-like protein